MFYISNIGRLRIQSDGEGIRTLIITHGCYLKCKYCINSHTWKANSPVKARSLTAEDLYREIVLDKLYFLSTGGGVTFGGGEPLQYADEIMEFRKISGSEFSIFAETSLNIERKMVEKANSCVDHFIVDIKTMNTEVYRMYTGGELNISLDNLQWLLEHAGSEKVTVRIPIIPGYTTWKDQKASEEALRKMGVTKFDLFTYIVKKTFKNL